MIDLAIIGTWFIYFATMSCFSYGAGSWLRKLVGRIPQQFICGAVQGASPILIAMVSEKWGVYTLCIALPSITLGVLGGWKDTDVNASAKEFLTGLTLFLPALFLI